MLQTRIGNAWKFSVLLPLIGCTACAHMAQDTWTGQDKTVHFAASAALAMAGGAVAEHQNASPARSRNIGFAFSISLGAAKEGFDSRAAGTGWSWKDFAWDVAGAATGYTLYYLSD
ncbi:MULTISPECIES: YfiM family lipoprotein [Sodalis]|uniref:Putative lipoprotein n=1 Tax=Sodalis ligni TaxID=2697027 RepID=A0A4R1NCC5_9GAMM|nr:YfiM family lipoprotein [Sodalis ligni]TCL04409.1 putative lipoprotein [Sodalis ligni]